MLHVYVEQVFLTIQYLLWIHISLTPQQLDQDEHPINSATKKCSIKNEKNSAILNDRKKNQEIPLR